MSIEVDNFFVADCPVGESVLELRELQSRETGQAVEYEIKLHDADGVHILATYHANYFGVDELIGTLAQWARNLKGEK